MNCEDTRHLLPDYLMRTIGESDGIELETHLEHCAECRAAYADIARVWEKLALLPNQEPGPGLREQFYADLESASRKLESRRPAGFWANFGLIGHAGIRPSLLHMVLPAFFLLIGALIGHLITGQAGGSQQQQVSQLRAELEQMKGLVAISLLQQPSASERLRGVAWGTRLDEADRKVLRALVDAMNSDPSVNVRLAAVDALQHYSDDEEIRDAMVRSLSTQDSPLVQIALIDAMVNLRENRSIAVLRDLADDPQLNQTVRERAKWGLAQLI
ncbi:MAG: HEAT repeat domain-containing protein [Acidobacteriota bacterium]